MVDKARILYKDPRFREVLLELDDSLHKIGFSEASYGELFKNPELFETEDNFYSQANFMDTISDIEAISRQLKKMGGKEMAEVNAKIIEITRKDTGLHPYAFKFDFNDNKIRMGEVFTIYNEATLEEARITQEIAQLQLDQLYSSPETPPWMREKIKSRYWKIMGDLEGPYCKKIEGGCGPCKIYTRKCDPLAFTPEEGSGKIYIQK